MLRTTPQVILAFTLPFACALPAFAKPALPTAKVFLKGTKASSGLFTVHSDKERAFLEVPSSKLNRPFLLATAISGGPTFTGFQWQESVAVFQRRDRFLLLVEKEVRYQLKNPGKPVASVVKRTYTDRMLAKVPIVALKGSNPIVDLRRLFGAEAKAFFGPVAAKLDGSVARVVKSKVFPKNLELQISMPDHRRDGRFTTLSYSLSSISRRGGYRPRKADDRVGYFLTASKDFSDATAGGDRFVRYIHRWNLQKADGSLPKSPVRKPIVFYIEDTVPFRFRQAVREGILEWNKAFLTCGLQNALVVRQQTKTEFANLDPEDVRYNFFRWIASGRAFAMGPSRVNPWTGEILDADIVFDESMVRSYLREYELALRQAPRKFFAPNIQKLLVGEKARRYLPFALGPIQGSSDLDSPFAAPKATHCGLGNGVAHQLSISMLALGIDGDTARGGKDFPQAFLDQIVKDVVMHEVGHTLGLRHNFAASSWRPLSQINGKDRPGDVCASVMDYNPINIAANPTQGQGHYTMQSIGPYDYWAIRYGYDPSESSARKGIASVGSAQFLYATDEDTRGPDPYVQRWDLGKDPLVHTRERFALVERLMPKAVERAVKKGQNYADARRAVDMLISDYVGASMTAARFVGGQRTYRFHKGDKGGKPPLVPVPAKKQREALHLICTKVLAKDPFELKGKTLQLLGKGYWSHWGSNDSRTAHSYPYQERILTVQSWALFALLNPGTMERLLDTESKLGKDEDLLTLPELFTTLSETIFGLLLDARKLTGQATVRSPLVPTTQRNLQRLYADQLIGMVLESRGPTPPAGRQIARLEVKVLIHALSGVLSREPEHPDQYRVDPYTRGHLEELIGRLKRSLEATYRLR
ncbi:MAG: zinc-dependent metalloprotease [Planctomycetes bacterium]|nr:zinc-dependent metalloprotease [Planctomycetota bacterium]